MKRTILFSLALIIGFLGFALYQYFRKPIDIKSVDPAFAISPSDLKQQLITDYDSMKKFGNSVIVIEGEISSLERTNTSTVIIIDSNVRCELDKNSNLDRSKGKVKIKGILGGYDDLFGEALLVKCEIVETEQTEK